VTGCDVSCLMQIRGRMTRRREQVRVLHLAQVLAWENGA
jgi:Fe-S oxidoreductase